MMRLFRKNKNQIDKETQLPIKQYLIDDIKIEEQEDGLLLHTKEGEIYIDYKGIDKIVVDTKSRIFGNSIAYKYLKIYQNDSVIVIFWKKYFWIFTKIHQENFAKFMTLIKIFRHLNIKIELMPRYGAIKLFKYLKIIFKVMLAFVIFVVLIHGLIINGDLSIHHLQILFYMPILFMLLSNINASLPMVEVLNADINEMSEEEIEKHFMKWGDPFYQ